MKDHPESSLTEFIDEFMKQKAVVTTSTDDQDSRDQSAGEQDQCLAKKSISDRVKQTLKVQENQINS